MHSIISIIHTPLFCHISYRIGAHNNIVKLDLYDVIFKVNLLTQQWHLQIILKSIELSLKSPWPPCLWACFHPYPLFQWYSQSKESLLNLSMKCWNSVFNAQGSRLIIVLVHVGAVKIYVAAVEALRKKERHDETQFITKIVLFISLCKIFISSYVFDAMLCRNWLLSPPNRGTLGITLLSKFYHDIWKLKLNPNQIRVVHYVHWVLR
jgi:hypothetical protein